MPEEKGRRKGHLLEAQWQVLPCIDSTGERKICAVEFTVWRNDTTSHKGPSKDQNHLSKITLTNFR